MSKLKRAAIREVVVLDDDERLLARYSRARRRMGKVAVTTSNPAAATQLAKLGQIDLAIVDLVRGLAPAFGIPIIRDLKRDTPTLAVIAIAGDLRFATAVEAIRSGARTVMRKPIGIAEILRRY